MSKWARAAFGSLYAIPSRNGLTRPSSVRGEGYRMAAMGEIFASDYVGDSDMDRVRLNERELGVMMLTEHDLLFARQSLVLSGAGKCSIVKGLSEPTTFESHLIRVRLASKKANPLFYMYYFHSPVSPMHSIVQQGVQAGIRASDLEALDVVVPPKEVQDRIADKLSLFDSAIENARRQIALLEEAAMRLYREWFVVHADPKWEKRRIGDVIEFNPKVQIPKETVHEIVPMSALQVNSMILDSATIEHGISKLGSKFADGDTLLARITPCLENGKTAFVGNLKSSCGASGSTEFIVMRSKKLNPYMVYLIARTPDFREAAIKSMSGADGRQRAKEDILKNIPYRLPSEGLIKKFGDVAGSMFSLAYLLQSQIESLTEARDRLLPKLMSGEIEV